MHRSPVRSVASVVLSSALSPSALSSSALSSSALSSSALSSSALSSSALSSSALASSRPRWWAVAVAAAFALLLSSSATATNDTYGLGNGHDGPLIATGAYSSISRTTSLTAPASPGSTSIAVVDTFNFPVGRLVMLVRSAGVVPARVVGDTATLDLEANDIGRYELARITAKTTLPGIGAGVQLTLDQALDRAWPVDGSQVVEVPEHTTVSVAAGTVLGRRCTSATAAAAPAASSPFSRHRR